MDCSEAGKKGGQSRSERKRAASAQNLARARQLRAAMAETEKHIAEARANGVTDLFAERWFADAGQVLERFERVSTSQQPVLVLNANQKASE